MPYSEAYVLICVIENNISQTAMTDTFHEKETMHGTDKRSPTWVLIHRRV